MASASCPRRSEMAGGCAAPCCSPAQIYNQNLRERGGCVCEGYEWPHHSAGASYQEKIGEEVHDRDGRARQGNVAQANLRVVVLCCGTRRNEIKRKKKHFWGCGRLLSHRRTHRHTSQMSASRAMTTPSAGSGSSPTPGDGGPRGGRGGPEGGPRFAGGGPEGGPRFAGGGGGPDGGPRFAGGGPEGGPDGGPLMDDDDPSLGLGRANQTRKIAWGQ